MEKINLRRNDRKMLIEVVTSWDSIENKKLVPYVAYNYVIPFSEIKYINCDEFTDITKNDKEYILHIFLAGKNTIKIHNISLEDCNRICDAFFNAKDIKQVVG